MTEYEAMRRLKGAFNPDSKTDFWAHDFLAQNICAISALLHIQVGCACSDTAHINPCGQIPSCVDYVPVSTDGTRSLGILTVAVYPLMCLLLDRRLLIHSLGRQNHKLWNRQRLLCCFFGEVLCNK